MCPVCLTSAALVAVSFGSAGGLVAIAIRKFGIKNADRRNEDVNHHD